MEVRPIVGPEGRIWESGPSCFRPESELKAFSVEQ